MSGFGFASKYELDRIKNSVDTVYNRLGSATNLRVGLASSGGSNVVVALDTVVTTLVAPATNINGVIIRGLTHYNTGTSSDITISYKSSAPATISDASAKYLLMSANLVLSTVPFPFLIPGGLGIYGFSSVAGTGIVALLYDAL